MNPWRLGVYGGAFDPPHLGHVALARQAVTQLGLDELRILPTGQAWHKARELTPAAHRLAMARLAFEGIGKVVIDDREMHRIGPSYTIDTLRELADEHPGAGLYLVIGEDQARAFAAWQQADSVAAMAVICVAERPHEGPAPVAAPWSSGLPLRARTERLALPPMPHRATDIRRALAQRGRVDQLVPGPVARYIEQHHLYQTV